MIYQFKKQLTLFILGTFVILLHSCTEVIDIDLNTAAEQLVVQGDISTKAGPHFVQLNKSVNFDEQNNFPAVTDATIIIKDNTGNSETLTHIGEGKYSTNTISGVLGRTYTLEIYQGGKVYTASSTIPLDEVSIDSIYTRISTFGREPSNRLVPVFTDPLGKENYYRFTYSINSKVEDRILLLNDKSNDGETNTRSLRGTNVNIGDSVEIEIQSIDQAVYNYLDGFLAFNGGFNQSATPANPTSNIIGNNVLGYFSAHTSRSKKTIITP